MGYASLRTVLILALAVTVLVFVVGPVYGLIRGIPDSSIVLVIGLAASGVLIGNLLLLERRRARSQYDGPARPRTEAGQTIYVPMVEDNGEPLPRAEQARRLADARRVAEPRDTVVPVNRPGPPA